MASGLDVKDRFVRWLVMAPLQPVAQGVWMVRGGLPDKIMNVYFIRDGSCVLAFDTGIRAMARGIAAAAASLGGLTRVVLGHPHPDHRGGAAGLGVPVYCHPDEVANAEGDGGADSWHLELLDRRNRALFKPAVRFFDGGPVPVAGTVSEDDEIAGFRVVHLQGHTPGQIGLWRSADRLALVSDCFYTLDPFTHKSGPPRVPHCAFNHDTTKPAPRSASSRRWTWLPRGPVMQSRLPATSVLSLSGPPKSPSGTISAAAI